MEDDPIKKAAELLLKGGRMLEIACPVCHDPIYRLKDKSMFCITCDKKVIWEEDEDNSEIESVSKLENSQSAISKKISQLESQLLEETDHGKILELAELIKKLEKLI